jgi:hypothetical protein
VTRLHLTRLPSWRTQLARYLAEAARIPFVEGRHDCALFAAGAIRAMTGEDLAAPFRGRYRTTRGGLRVLRRAGYRDHLDLAVAHLDEVPPAFAHVGDIAAVPGDDGPALGVVQGERIYVLRPEGLSTVSRLLATRAWRVPE